MSSDNSSASSAVPSEGGAAPSGGVATPWEERVQPDEQVVLETSHGFLCFAPATRGEQIRLFKTKINLAPIVGAPYGAVFELQTPSATTPVQVDEPLLPDISNEELESDTEGVDNRELLDTNDSQTVTQEKIMDLREQGAKPEAIVRALKDGSSTFRQKTVYSREKWLREKIKKYTRRFRVEKATSRSILQVVQSRGNSRTLNLRNDSLAQIVSHSNATAGSTVCVVDTTGLAIGAVSERMGCRGKLIAPYMKGGIPQQLINRFNLEQRFMRSSLVDSTKRQKVEYPSTLLPHQQSALREDDGICEDLYQFLVAVPVSTLFPEGNEEQGEKGESGQSTDSAAQQEGNDSTKTTSHFDFNGELIWDFAAPLTSVDEAEEYAYRVVADEHKEYAFEKDKALDENDEKCGKYFYGTPGIVVSALADNYHPVAQQLGINPKIMPPLKPKASTIGPLIRLDRRRSLSNLNSRQRAVLYWQRVAKRQQRPSRDHVRGYLKEGLDSLVIVSDFNPLQTLLGSFRFLKPSRPFVVYNTELYPLQECYGTLQKLRMATNLSILQPWTRKYQVLDQRTHPEMLLDGSSGFILTGNAVVNEYCLSQSKEVNGVS
eukprot:gb/GECG01004491.1/.p1 GENE.gb/GECG01004491.1/~~gb/GECG01004491.1/.p1  ORF type:complete len:603 (+),score=72.49 gb/GECG01004491.1/:1-1809(+)